jgi:hypothetical protein
LLPTLALCWALLSLFDVQPPRSLGEMYWISTELEGNSSKSASFSAYFPTSKKKKKSSDYSIKPIAYIFPQFHAIPENDEFWGKNFTEWVNVKKADKNVYGVETLHPTPEVGYYDLLDYSTRKRQGRLLNDAGFYGIVYHHYWFQRPVMEKPLLARLKDGEPNLPFMLNWANEPWTARWDGNDNSKVLLKQVYGDMTEWRKHFDWMVPFFRHPQYIRSNGGKLQLMVYNPSHMGELGPRMFAAWRRWAAEEGLGGMDVIETRIDWDRFERGGTPDAVNEFSPRSGGGYDATEWALNGRFGTVFYRGASVCWDNTPRHVTDGGAIANPFCHYDLWKYSILASLGRIKRDPNPRGADNFFFINALNEWGEGNVLEPSIQWGDGYSLAFREALEMSNSIQWRDELIESGGKLSQQLDREGANSVDVCVLVQVYRNDGLNGNTIFTLGRMLQSLREQRNRRWRAVVFPVQDDGNIRVDGPVFDTYDPRITVAKIPKGMDMPPEGAAESDRIDSDGTNATDWVISNLGDISASCAGATYILVVNSNSTYGPNAFDAAAKRSYDVIGLSVISRDTMLWTEKPMIWHRRCERFLDVSC